MVFDEPDESFRTDAESRHSAGRFLPHVGLALEEITILRGGDELLGTAPVIGVIRFVTIGQSNHGAVVQVVVPKAVKVVTAFAAGPDELGFLGLVFRDQDNRPIAGGDACRPAHRADDVFIRRIDNALRGVETKAVEMEFFDPVAAIGNEKLAHGVRNSVRRN